MLDLFVVALYSLGMLGLGWWGMKRARNREDYLVAGRRLGPGMYLGTLSAVVLGGASTVGTVKLGYTYGLSGLWLCASLGLGLIVLSLVLAKPLMKLKLYTVTQVLERRYTPAAKLISSIIMFAYDLMLAVTSTIGIGTVLSVIFGMAAWQAVVIGGIVAGGFHHHIQPGHGTLAGTQHGSIVRLALFHLFGQGQVLMAIAISSGAQDHGQPIRRQVACDPMRPDLAHAGQRRLGDLLCQLALA